MNDRYNTNETRLNVVKTKIACNKVSSVKFKFLKCRAQTKSYKMKTKN